MIYRAKNGFTLAEVLIVLGIIGIIATMTIPTLIQKEKHKALEVAFMKSYANLQNAYNKSILDYSPETNYSGTVNGYSELASAIYKEYRNTVKIEDDDYLNSIKTYTLKPAKMGECSQGTNTNAILPDGSSINTIFYNCDKTWITIDTNGLKRGPNAYGHDIFVFTISNEGKFGFATGETSAVKEQDGTIHYIYDTNNCSKNSSSNINGITCAQYAASNVCPDDSTKTYWECLP